MAGTGPNNAQHNYPGQGIYSELTMRHCFFFNQCPFSAHLHTARPRRSRHAHGPRRGPRPDDRLRRPPAATARSVHLVLPSYSGFYWVLPSLFLGFTQCSLALPSVTGFNRVLVGFS